MMQNSVFEGCHDEAEALAGSTTNPQSDGALERQAFGLEANAHPCDTM